MIVFDVASTSRILSMRSSESTISPWCGICPPTRPVLPPCGTIGVFVSLASLRMADTSATEPGRSTIGDGHDRGRASRADTAPALAGSMMAYLSPTIAAKRG